MPIRKYSELASKNASPTLIFSLPELSYPKNLNAVEVVLEGAIKKGWSDRTVYYSADHTYTFEKIREMVHQSMFAFRALGVMPGDVVMLRMPDTVDLVVTLLALQAIGAIAMPTYIQLRSRDLIYRAEDSKAKFLITALELLSEAVSVSATLGDKIKVVAFPFDREEQLISYNQFLPNNEVEEKYAVTNAEELCLFLYTSGSTGKPKATTHCHRDMLAVSDTYWRYCIAPGPQDVFAGPPSIAFALGFGMFVYFPLRLGNAAVLEADKSPELALKQIQKYSVTIFAAVTSYYNILARLIQDTGEKIPSLVHPMTGGEPLTSEVERFWNEVTNIPLEQFIGTTETLHCFVTSTQPLSPPKKATLGRIVPGYEAEILDPKTYVPVAEGQEGLLAIRGPTGTVYWNKPEQQKKVVRDVWNVFQDIVWRDNEGYIHYVARYDEMIVSGGHNISPVQVESVLMEHEAVVECACVAAPDPNGKRGAVVKAYIVTNGEVMEDNSLILSLQNFVKKNAPPYMYPRVISFEKFLPKTINGKLLRSELRKRAEAKITK